MLKDFQVDLELSPRDNRVIQTGATYWSHDVNTAKIVVNLKRNSEPIILSSTVSVRMIMVFDDNDTQKKQVHKMTIDDTQNGVVSLVLPKETLGFVGNVLCGVYVNYGENQSTDNGYFTFSMRRSLIDGEFPQLENGYVSEFQTMLDYMIETASEFDNVEEELNKRIDVIEKDIASNEVAKKPQLEALEKKVNNIDIGVSNLVSDQNDLWTNGYYHSEGHLVLSYVDTAYINKISTLYDNYTLQLWGSLEVLEKGYLSIVCYDLTGNSLGKSIFQKVESDYTSFNFKTLEGTSYIKLSIPIKKSNLNKIKLKLEKGNMPSDWSPPVVDIITKKEMNDLQKQIDELKNAITTLGGTL